MQMAKPTSSHDERDAKEYCISDIFCRLVNYKSRQKNGKYLTTTNQALWFKKIFFIMKTAIRSIRNFIIRKVLRILIHRIIMCVTRHANAWSFYTYIRVDMKTAKPLRNYWRCRIITNGDVGRCTSFDFYSHRSICCSMKMYLEVSKNQHTLQNKDF